MAQENVKYAFDLSEADVGSILEVASDRSDIFHDMSIWSRALNLKPPMSYTQSAYAFGKGDILLILNVNQFEPNHTLTITVLFDTRKYALIISKPYKNEKIDYEFWGRYILHPSNKRSSENVK